MLRSGKNALLIEYYEWNSPPRPPPAPLSTPLLSICRPAMEFYTDGSLLVANGDSAQTSFDPGKPHTSRHLVKVSHTVSMFDHIEEGVISTHPS